MVTLFSMASARAKNTTKKRLSVVFVKALMTAKMRRTESQVSTMASMPPRRK